MEKERLNKYLASCGVCSRRDADSLIDQGLVTVNGKPAAMGMRVSAEDSILVRGKSIHGKNDKVVLAYYKPVCPSRRTTLSFPSCAKNWASSARC